MAKELKVNAEPRDAAGSIESRRLRRSGVFPAVIYGSGRPVQLVQVNEHDFRKTLGTHAGEHMIVDVQVSGQDVRKVLLQDVQQHPITGRILHADFHEISMTEKLRVKIPIQLMGEPVGVTQLGGVMEQVMREIEVECLPTDLVEHFVLDVSPLSIGDRRTVGDIPLDPAKYTVISHKNLSVVSVGAPREEEAEVVPEAAAEGAVAEPEVLREKKEEGEEGAPEEGKGAAKGAAPAAKGAAPAAKGAAPAAKGAAPAAKGAAPAAKGGAGAKESKKG
jgi:large subunit ribosomal protein L25